MTNTKKSVMVCLECLEEGIPIQRTGDGAREKGHLKHLFCKVCNTQTQHVEIRDVIGEYEEFLADKERYLKKYVYNRHDYIPFKLTRWGIKKEVKI